MDNRIVLIGGGARSGKSAFALLRARALGQRRVFVATAAVGDAEMRVRVARHRAERGDAFATVEEGVALVRVLQELVDVDVVLVDCLTLWLSNLLLGGEDEQAIEGQVRQLGEVLAARRFHAVLVTNEVGMGVVPPTRLGRQFRDIAGRAHQVLGRCADEIYVLMMGAALRLEPVAVDV